MTLPTVKQQEFRRTELLLELAIERTQWRSQYRGKDEDEDWAIAFIRATPYEWAVLDSNQ